MIIDSEDLDETSAYKLLIGSIIPRPIAWVSTLSTQGVGNIAPISFFTCVGRKPPRVSLSIQPRSDRVTLKDTLINIRDTGEFVTNLATLPQITALHHSSIEFEPDVDEFDAVGVEKEPSAMVKPPRIKGAPIALECRVAMIVPSPDNALSNLVIGDVVGFNIRDDLYVNGRVDFGGIHPVGRLAAEYTLVDNAFVPPLDETLMLELTGRRMKRLDDRGETYSAIDGPTWSPSGSLME
ncbi:flavin reductase family protein [Mycobacterium colombiense]|uniref:flavin reductase family protein n=1 Tax=Mycobacterium colombiense TaxID=339268 RepID=UPI00200ACDE2|nr:flavin reductase family protein [Mycobacterium colombiense]MCK8642354.1 flavin reductase family protein [Mycobacterium colombiense]